MNLPALLSFLSLSPFCVRLAVPVASQFPLPRFVLFSILRTSGGQVKRDVKRDTVDVQINSDLSSCTNPDAFGAYR